MHVVGVSINAYVSDDPQPGLVRFTLADAAGREWQFLEKVPVVSLANLTAKSVYPQSGEMACIVVSRSSGQGRQIARIDTRAPWGVASVEGETVFDVFADKIREVSPNSAGESADQPKSLLRVKIAALFGVFALCALLLWLEIAHSQGQQLAAVGVAALSGILLSFVRCEACHSSIYYRAGGTRKLFGNDFYRFVLARQCPCCGLRRR